MVLSTSVWCGSCFISSLKWLWTQGGILISNRPCFLPRDYDFEAFPPGGHPALPCPPPTCSPRDEAYYTSLPKAVKEATEDALVRPAIWVSDQHVYITTGCLPPSVGTTRHTQQPRVESLS